jgi:hypothetical protein
MDNPTKTPLTTNDAVRDALRRMGLPQEADKVGKTLRTVRSTKFYEEGATLASEKFFTKQNPDGFWDNYKFPQQETGVVIRGIAVDHNLHFAASPVDIYGKQQQIFEQSSYFRFKYRLRDDRLVFRVADLVPYTIASIGNAAQAFAKPNSALQNGIFMLPEPVLLAAQIETEFKIDIQSGFTLGANVATGGTAQPVVTGGGLTGAGQYLSLVLLIEELFEAHG